MSDQPFWPVYAFGASEKKLCKAAEAAYLELLVCMPPHRRRTMEGQALLSSLVDAIALCTLSEPEVVQNHFEQLAAKANP